jgi:hypothetical protein
MMMLEPVAKELTALSLAVLMSLGQWFGDGVAAYNKKDFKNAETSFTRVIGKKVTPNPFLEPALYWRAQTYIKQGNRQKAAADLARLLKHSESGHFATFAAADYKKLTGKAWDVVDLSTPEKTWTSFVRALKARDTKKLKRCCGGKIMGELLQALAREPEFWEGAAREIGQMQFARAVYNRKKDKAAVYFTGMGRGRAKERPTFVMERVNAKWLISSEFHPKVRREFEGLLPLSATEKRMEDMNKLRLFDHAIEVYRVKHNAVPAKLEDIRGYIQEFDRNRVSATDGKPFVFALPRDKQAEPWVYVSSSVKDSRLGLINGTVTSMAEREFKKLARKAGVRVPQAWKRITLTPDEEKAIRALIRQLGARTFGTRQAAYRKLKALGPKAGKLLEQATEDPDMEISLQAKKLLAEI